MDRSPTSPVCHCLQRSINCRTSKKHFLPQIVWRSWRASSASSTPQASTSAASSGTRIILFLLYALAVSSAHADVIVLANRTPAPVGFRFVPKSGAAQQLTLATGVTLPLFLDGKADVIFSSLGGQKDYKLDANCAYYFGRSPDGRI